MTGLVGELRIRFTREEPGRVEAEMPITDAIRQPYGLVHGGATLALLETVASRGSELAADLSREQPYGVDVHVRHRAPGREGTLHAEAQLDREEPSSKGHRKLWWRVRATDDVGAVISEGEILCLLVAKG